MQNDQGHFISNTSSVGGCGELSCHLGSNLAATLDKHELLWMQPQPPRTVLCVVTRVAFVPYIQIGLKFAKHRHTHFNFAYLFVASLTMLSADQTLRHQIVKGEYSSVFD
jgi:hypothetical protein